MRLRWVALIGVVLAVGPVTAIGSPPRDGGATAHAYSVRVIVPGADGGGTESVSAPDDAAAVSTAGSYVGADIVSWGQAVANASAAPGQTSTASASAQVSTLSLFGGEVRATGIRAQVQARASSAATRGGFEGSSIATLAVAGQPVAVVAGQRVPLGDWGYAITLAQGAVAEDDAFRGNVVALDIRLTTDRGGLPAGTQILVGYAEVAVSAPPPTATTPTPPSPTIARPEQRPPAAPRPAAPPQDGIRPALRIPEAIARLTPGGYVFPVFGPVSFTNTFNAARANTGWHHGEDIFGALGAPVLAVADGTLFSVGWNDVGGYRLWLRDRRGNEFYYAHMSAYTPLAVNGASVRAGDVIGFVGDSGDARGTPYHLHFEIHPVGLLSLGYDGVVAAYPYLIAWRRLRDARFPEGGAWAPAVRPDATAPMPGAVVVHVADISAATGLRPGSIGRAFVGHEGEGDPSRNSSLLREGGSDR